MQNPPEPPTAFEPPAVPFMRDTLTEWAGYPVLFKPMLRRAFDHLEPGSLLILPRAPDGALRALKGERMPTVVGWGTYQVTDKPYRDPVLEARFHQKEGDLALAYHYGTGKLRVLCRHPLVGLLLHHEVWRMPLRRRLPNWWDATWQPGTVVGTNDERPL